MTRHAAFANARLLGAPEAALYIVVSVTTLRSLAEVAHYTADADRRKAVLGQAKRA